MRCKEHWELPTKSQYVSKDYSSFIEESLAPDTASVCEVQQISICL
jgi:hypothetical protein